METHYQKEKYKTENHYSKKELAELPEWIQKLDFYLSTFKDKYKKSSSE